MVEAVCFVTGVAVAAISDLHGRRVANELSLVLLAGGLVSQGLSCDGILGALVGLALLLPAFAARWVGGGDVKLLAACGAWLGPMPALAGGLTGIALGGALSIAMAVVGGIGREVGASVVASLVTRRAPVAPQRDRGLIVPLALPLGLGCTLAYFGVIA